MVLIVENIFFYGSCDFFLFHHGFFFLLEN